MIYTDAQRNTTLATLLDKGFKSTTRQAIVARIDTHLIHRVGSDRGYLRHEVNVGNDGCREAISAHPLNNRGKGLALTSSLCRKAHNRRTRKSNALHLCHTRLNIGCRRIGH